MRRLHPRPKKRSPVARMQMEWLLDFLNTPDTNALSTGEFLKLDYDLTRFWAGFVPTDRHPMFKNIHDTPQKRAHVKRDQTYLRSCLEEILQTRDKLLRKELEEEDTEDPYVNVKKYSVAFSAQMSKDGETIAILPPDSYSHEEFQALLYYKLVELLANFPLTRIKVCANKGCTRLFFQPTEKTRNYCSRKCTYQASTRKYREENPDKYRESQRKVMSKRYDRKVRQRLGPNVKIQKRPRKGGK